jgi:hypothetical protein
LEYYKSNGKASFSWQFQAEVFASSKSSIHGISFCSSREDLITVFGEYSVSLLSSLYCHLYCQPHQPNYDEFYFKDWVLNAKTIADETIMDNYLEISVFYHIYSYLFPWI